LNLTGYGCRVLKYIPIVQLSGKRNRFLRTWYAGRRSLQWS
jgi:hypothetical protein